MSTVDELRERLEARLTTLRRRVGKIEGDLQRQHSADSEEQAIELENDEVLEHLDDRSREEIEQIRSALRRMDDGTYGECSECGETINPKRLAALPFTTRCVGCAA